MIQKALLISLLLESAAIAGPSLCPTCYKTYAILAVEKVLLPKTQEKKSKGSSIDASPQIHEEAEQKKPVDKIITKKRPKTENSSPQSFSSHAPKRDAIQKVYSHIIGERDAQIPHMAYKQYTQKRK